MFAVKVCADSLVAGHELPKLRTRVRIAKQIPSAHKFLIDITAHYFMPEIQNVQDARDIIEKYNFEAKLKTLLGITLGIFYGVFVITRPSEIFLCASYSAPVSYFLIRDLSGGQKEYKEAKKTLDSLLC